MTKTVVQRSAGGVVVRRQDNRFEVALIQVEGRDDRRWQLPKGWVEKGEAGTEAALREVNEETGLQAEIVDKLPTIDYWFYEGKETRVHKYVSFYLMRATGGKVAEHDAEVVTACWFRLDAAIEALAFDSERDLIREALGRLEENPNLLNRN